MSSSSLIIFIITLIILIGFLRISSDESSLLIEHSHSVLQDFSHLNGLLNHVAIGQDLHKAARFQMPKRSSDFGGHLGTVSLENQSKKLSFFTRVRISVIFLLLFLCLLLLHILLLPLLIAFALSTS